MADNSISEALNSDIDGELTIVNLVTENRASLNTIIAAERFSQLNKLLRVTAFVLRFVNNIRACIAKTEPIIEELTCEEFENARLRWLLYVQSEIKEPSSHISHVTIT